VPGKSDHYIPFADQPQLSIDSGARPPIQQFSVYEVLQGFRRQKMAKWERKWAMLSRSFCLCSEMFLRDFKNVLFFFDILFRSTIFFWGSR
jgi:hypothetical protein